MDTDFAQRLAAAPQVARVSTHAVFDHAAGGAVGREGIQRFVEQFWHPSHYFPSFLAGLISVAPPLPIKTSLSLILFQELGEGDPARAHESVYLRMLEELGFDTSAIVDGSPSPATAALVDVYAHGSSDFLFGLGCIYGTEAIDLPIVSGLGRAVTAVTGVPELEWVVLHTVQEPDHMESATAAVEHTLSPAEEAAVMQGAEAVWDGWNAFYSALLDDLTVPAPSFA